MVKGRIGEQLGVVRSTTVTGGVSISIATASRDEVGRRVFRQVEKCSNGLSSEVPTNLVNTLSPKKDGGCLARIGLVLCLMWGSVIYPGGGYLMGEDASLLAISVGFWVGQVRVLFNYVIYELFKSF